MNLKESERQHLAVSHARRGMLGDKNLRLQESLPLQVYIWEFGKTDLISIQEAEIVSPLRVGSLIELPLLRRVAIFKFRFFWLKSTLWIYSSYVHIMPTCVSTDVTPASCWPRRPMWRLWTSWKALWRGTDSWMVTITTQPSSKLTSQSWMSLKTGVC